MVEALIQTPIETSARYPETGILVDPFIFSPNEKLLNVYNPEIGIPYSGLQVYPNGVDIKIGDTSEGVRYERESFKMMLEEDGEGLWIGPHLIDFIFNGGRFGLAGSRPDGIQLVSNGVVKINRVMEAKSGPAEQSDESIPRKIPNLIRMFEELRGQPSLLASALQKTIGRYYEIPEVIFVPPCDEIGLTFVTKQERNTTEENPFLIDFRRLEIPDLAT